MATDFGYNNKTIVAGGPIKPNGKDMPIDSRTRVETYADISTIPVPYVGMKITVKADETNNNETNNDNPDERTESSVGSYDEGVNTINSATEGLDDPDDNTFYSLLKYLIPDYDGDHVDNVDNFERNESSSKRTEEDEVNTINIDSSFRNASTSYNQNEDIEMGIRKRK